MPDRHPDGILDPGPSQVGLEGVEFAAGDEDDRNPPALLHRLENLAVEVHPVRGRPGRGARKNRQRQGGAGQDGGQGPERHGETATNR